MLEYAIVNSLYFLLSLSLLELSLDRLFDRKLYVHLVHCYLNEKFCNFNDKKTVLSLSFSAHQHSNLANFRVANGKAIESNKHKSSHLAKQITVLLLESDARHYCIRQAFTI